MTTPSPRGPNTYFDETIVRRYRAGLNTVAIADKLKMSRHFVRTRLIANGVDMSVRQTGHKISDIWSMDEDERREAIAQRAARGAREALENIQDGLGAQKRTKNKRVVHSAAQSGQSVSKWDRLHPLKNVVAGSISLAGEPRLHNPEPVLAHRTSSNAER